MESEVEREVVDILIDFGVVKCTHGISAFFGPEEFRCRITMSRAKSARYRSVLLSTARSETESGSMSALFLQSLDVVCGNDPNDLTVVNHGQAANLVIEHLLLCVFQ